MPTDSGQATYLEAVGLALDTEMDDKQMIRRSKRLSKVLRHDPASAGLTLDPAGTHTFETGADEILVVPLSGAVSVEVDGSHLDLDGRPDVFAGPTDFAYLPVGQVATLHSVAGGRFALCGARTDRVLPFRHGPVDGVPVELRGAGQASRQVRNFATPEGAQDLQSTRSRKRKPYRRPRCSSKKASTACSASSVRMPSPAS